MFQYRATQVYEDVNIQPEIDFMASSYFVGNIHIVIHIFSQLSLSLELYTIMKHRDNSIDKNICFVAALFLSKWCNVHDTDPLQHKPIMKFLMCDDIGCEDSASD